jgi:hypothetical protein
MAKIRKQRAKVASPSEVISTTVGLLTPQQGQEIKSTVIKYQNLKQGSRLYDHVKQCLESLDAFHMARYKLQQANYRLQRILDQALISRSELSKSNHWKFKLTNKKFATKDGTTEQRLVAADLYCWDTPDEDFTKKLPSYLPREQADSLELGFFDLGDINKPQASVPQDTSEDTEDGIDEDTSSDDTNGIVSDNDMRQVLEVLANLPDNVTSSTVQAFGRAYKNLPNMSSKAYFFHQISTDEEKTYLYNNALSKSAKAQLKKYLGPEDFEYDKAVGE